MSSAKCQRFELSGLVGVGHLITVREGDARISVLCRRDPSQSADERTEARPAGGAGNSGRGERGAEERAPAGHGATSGGGSRVSAVCSCGLLAGRPPTSRGALPESGRVSAVPARSRSRLGLLPTPRTSVYRPKSQGTGVEPKGARCEALRKADWLGLRSVEKGWEF